MLGRLFLVQGGARVQLPGLLTRPRPVAVGVVSVVVVVPVVPAAVMPAV